MTRAAENRARLTRHFSSLEVLTLSQISADPTDMVAMDDIEGRKVNLNPLVEFMRSDLARNRWRIRQARLAREVHPHAPPPTAVVLGKGRGRGSGSAP